tara:strand:- start:263 stop:460 length:198 start_codon:yes stop_codon:yes gene_type:complete
MIIENEIRTGYKTNSFQGKFTEKNISKKNNFTTDQELFPAIHYIFLFFKEKNKKDAAAIWARRIQ